jgi:hypothetical protein
MSDLVCPECGNDEFQQRRVTSTMFTVTIDCRGNFTDQDEQIEDGGETDGAFACTDCFTEYVDHDDLITEEAYNEQEDDQ